MNVGQQRWQFPAGDHRSRRFPGWNERSQNGLDLVGLPAGFGDETTAARLGQRHDVRGLQIPFDFAQRMSGQILEMFKLPQSNSDVGLRLGEQNWNRAEPGIPLGTSVAYDCRVAQIKMRHATRASDQLQHIVSEARKRHRII